MPSYSRAIGINCLGLFLISVCMGLASALQADDESLLIEHPWIREMPPGAPTMAAYMQITNVSDEKVIIKAATSDMSKSVELHQVNTVNDVMQMRQLPELAIEAGQTVELKPGGIHIMLIGLEKRLVQGDNVEIQLELSAEQNVKTIVPVKKEE